MVGDSKAKVIPLHGNSGRAAAQRRAGQRTQASRQHPSLLSEPGTQASAEQIAAVVRSGRAFPRTAWTSRVIRADSAGVGPISR